MVKHLNANYHDVQSYIDRSFLGLNSRTTTTCISIIQTSTPHFQSDVLIHRAYYGYVMAYLNCVNGRIHLWKYTFVAIKQNGQGKHTIDNLG